MFRSIKANNRSLVSGLLAMTTSKEVCSIGKIKMYFASKINKFSLRKIEVRRDVVWS